MNIFEQAATSNKQGDIGEAAAIFEFTKQGFTVSKPLGDATYDIVVELNGILKRVQVKTSSAISPDAINKTSYNVTLEQRGGKSGKIYKPRCDTDYDLLFVLVADGRRWIIPTPEIGAITKIVVGNTKYTEFILEP